MEIVKQIEVNAGPHTVQFYDPLKYYLWIADEVRVRKIDHNIYSFDVVFESEEESRKQREDEQQQEEKENVFERIDRLTEGEDEGEGSSGDSQNTDSAEAGVNQEEQDDDSSWFDLNPSMAYKVTEDEIVLANKVSDDSYYNLARWPRDLVNKVYNKMGERTNKKDLLEICEEVALKVNKSLATYLFHIFEQFVAFDGYVEKEGTKLVFVKDDFSLSSELQKKKQIENGMIDAPGEDS